MRQVHNAFAVLADRAGLGDASAKVQLRQEMEPEVVRIVRRVIQNGAGPSPLDRRILAVADSLGLDTVSAAGEDGELLVRHVAQRVCATVMAGARPVSRQRFALEETVCN
jgi:hypothetical protein